MDGILRLVENAHQKLAPGVPLIGWDVAITTKGVFLLEGNFSCNFFRGHFDQDLYFRFVEDYFLDLEEQEELASTRPASEPGSPRGQPQGGSESE